MYMSPPFPRSFGFCSQYSESRGLHVELSRAVVAMSVSPREIVCSGGLCHCGARCMFRTKPAPTLRQGAPSDLGPGTPYGPGGGIAESLAPSPGL